MSEIDTTYKWLRFLGSPAIGNEYHAWGIDVKKGELVKVTQEQAEELFSDFPGSWQEVKVVDSKIKQQLEDLDEVSKKVINPVDIIIPTIKKIESLTDMVINMGRKSELNYRIIATCRKGSAAKNRNLGLNIARSEIIIMVDDDIIGFFQGWDRELITPLLKDCRVVMVSARLLNSDGSLGTMLGGKYSVDVNYLEVKKKRIPITCCAFRNNKIRFDENYIGSGFEDDDFSKQLHRKYPNGKFIVNNKVKLIHLNERKNQQGKFWEHNKKYFLKKWKGEEDVWMGRV